MAWPDDGFGIKAEICVSLWQTKGILSLIKKQELCWLSQNSYTTYSKIVVLLCDVYHTYHSNTEEFTGSTSELFLCNSFQLQCNKFTKDLAVKAFWHLLSICYVFPMHSSTCNVQRECCSIKAETPQGWTYNILTGYVDVRFFRSQIKKYRVSWGVHWIVMLEQLWCSAKCQLIR